MSDTLFDVDPEPGESAVEGAVDVAEVDVRPLLDQRVHDVGFALPKSSIPPAEVRSSSTQPALRKQCSSCQLPGRAWLAARSRPCRSTSS